MGRPKAKRVRLTVSDDVYKRLGRIAEEARMPLQLVYDDALLNGLCTLPDMYKSAIEFRKTRDGMIYEPMGEKQHVRTVLHKPEPNGSQGEESGESDLPFDPEIDPEFKREAPVASGSPEPVVERGHETEDGEAHEPFSEFE
jgi:hypothetical protein